MVNCCDNVVCTFIWKWFTPIVRFWGVISAVVIWIICVRHIEDGVGPFSIYLVVVASFTTILEAVFLFEPCITKCCNAEGCCYLFWMCVSWFDNWKRATVYVAISIVCYLDKGPLLPLTVTAGIVLDVLAIFYILRTYRVHNQNEAREHQPGQTVKSGKTYGRFENEDLKNKEMGGMIDEQPAIMAHDEDIEKGGNPFSSDDDDADPRGDAGLPSRYPP